MVNTTIQYRYVNIIIIIVASTPASTRPDPRGRGRGQDPRGRGRGHTILASRGLEAEARPRGLTSLQHTVNINLFAGRLLVMRVYFLLLARISKN